MKPITTTVLILLTIVVVVGGVVFAYGTPQKPDVSGGAIPAAAPADGSTSQAPAGMGGAAGGAVHGGGAPDAPTQVDLATQVAPEPDPSVPLAIEIPGCRCHSDDPKLVKEHEKYRMNQCAGCHAGQAPTGME